MSTNKIKDKALIFLGAMSALYLASFAAAHSKSPKVQKIALVGMGTSVILGVGAATLADDTDDDDPRMKDVYNEIERRKHNELSTYNTTTMDDTDDDIELDELENTPKSQFSKNHLNHGSMER